MNVKKMWANLAVEDVERTNKFYTTLGFKPNGPHSSKELVSFFFGDDNFIMHFFLKDSLQPAMKGDLADLKKGNEIIFTLAAQSKAEADAWADEIKVAGGTLVSQPEEFGPGYYGFVFSDPDGHKFNVFFMEGMK
ncbi:VOC family protein [Mucilaginibacter agri]|uniref:Glyoxalase n=1 Tax=Mucilaginibacter agri TaxID=2695265 RepID=A0A966DUH8_9SPHI|nr:VOC family protein [Mucilaginibacter agri]NCD69654.1 glyoxalase [Mucilaginibacter agri]